MTRAIQIRVDENLKRDADLVFDDLGLDTPTAIRLFLTEVVSTQSIPFDLKVVRTANGFSPEFEEEVLKASASKERVGPFSSASWRKPT